MKLFKKLFLHSPKSYVAAFIVGIALSALALATRGYKLLINYVDALTIAGALVFLFGMLLLVWYFGALDTFGYAFRRPMGRTQYKSLYEYSEANKEKRRRGNLIFMPYIVVGVLFFTVGIILSLFIGS
ncbi:MAG: DUF3899 domain-containing protein [Clostridiales bacterium]|nr:DUF3899 domain-containing protein [Clostridiales bacterium]